MLTQAAHASSAPTIQKNDPASLQRHWSRLHKPIHSGNTHRNIHCEVHELMQQILQWSECFVTWGAEGRMLIVHSSRVNRSHSEITLLQDDGVEIFKHFFELTHILSLAKFVRLTAEWTLVEMSRMELLGFQIRFGWVGNPTHLHLSQSAALGMARQLVPASSYFGQHFFLSLSFWDQTDMLEASGEG